MNKYFVIEVEEADLKSLEDLLKGDVKQLKRSNKFFKDLSDSRQYYGVQIRLGVEKQELYERVLKGIKRGLSEGYELR